MSELNKIPQILNAIIDGLQSRTLMNKAGLAAIRRIKTRTRRGEDVEGESFQAYSPKYAKKRAREGLPTHPVNLQWNDINGMLNQMDHFILQSNKGVEIDFKSDEKRTLASYHNELGVAKRGENIRHFFYLNEDDTEALAEIIENHFETVLASLT